MWAGTEVDLRVALAGSDFVAVDAVAAKVMGFEPLEIGCIYYASRDHVGVGDLSQINVVGAKIREVQRRFALLLGTRP